MLLIGYGNPGRGDDGLGPALVAELEHLAPPGLALQSDYQLAADHAYDIADRELVIFADAAMGSSEPFTFETLEPKVPGSFSSHSMSPGEVLYLARTLYKATTRAHLLAITGYSFGQFHEGLSEGAMRNLAGAREFLLKFAGEAQPV